MQISVFIICLMQFTSTAKKKRNITGKIKKRRKEMEVKMLYMYLK